MQSSKLLDLCYSCTHDILFLIMCGCDLFFCDLIWFVALLQYVQYNTFWTSLQYCKPKFECADLKKIYMFIALCVRLTNQYHDSDRKWIWNCKMEMNEIKKQYHDYKLEAVAVKCLKTQYNSISIVGCKRAIYAYIWIPQMYVHAEYNVIKHRIKKKNTLNTCYTIHFNAVQSRHSLIYFRVEMNRDKIIIYALQMYSQVFKCTMYRFFCKSNARKHPLDCAMCVKMNMFVWKRSRMTWQLAQLSLSGSIVSIFYAMNAIFSYKNRPLLLQ